MTDLVPPHAGADDVAEQSREGVQTVAPEDHITDSHITDSRITEIGEPERVDRELHPVATVLGVFALIAVITIGVFAFAALIGDDEPRSEVAQVVLPRLAGRVLPEAQAELERLGLIVDLRYEANELIARDVVVDQEPIAGARLEVGEQVVLVVSDGPAGVAVPDLSGVSAPEAVRLLSVLGLVGVPVDVNDERVPQGEVVGSNPAAGGRAVAGSEVQVLVSQGPEPRTVPEVVGRPSPEAFAMIGRADLQVGAVTFRLDPEIPPGTVLSTDPAPGAQTPRDTPVRVVVSRVGVPAAVPDLVGLTRRSAESLADAAGVSVTVRTETLEQGDRRNGLVISQTPIANSPIASGDAMTVVVGVVPPPPTTTTTTTTTPGATTTTAP